MKMPRKPRKIYPRTFLPHALLLPRAERLVAFVNSASADAVWPGIHAARVGKLRSALQAYLEALTKGPPRLSIPDLRRALNPVVGLCWSGPVTVTGSFFSDEHGQQHLLPQEFGSPASELLATAGDLLNPGTTVRVRKCECALYAGKCEGYLINDHGPNRGKGDKPRCLPEHVLLRAELNALHNPKNSASKRRAALLEQFRNDSAARAEAARRLRREK